MNLILFEPAEIERPLPRGDRRAVHLLDVLRRTVGDTFDVGVINGPRAKGTLVAVGADALTLTFAFEPPALPTTPLVLIIGLPRPQTARDILRDATTLGATALHFVRTDKGERNYAQSTLWSSQEWRRHLIAGAEQAFDTRIPEISHDRSLADVLAALDATATRVALDNYTGAQPLGGMTLARAAGHVLALGPERGWSEAERALLARERFAFAHLGSRVLRLETACIAALAILRSKLGLM